VHTASFIRVISPLKHQSTSTRLRGAICQKAETSVYFYETSQHHIPEGSHLQKCFLCHHIRSTLGLPSLYPVETTGHSLGIKRAEHEAGHTPSSSAISSTVCARTHARTHTHTTFRNRNNLYSCIFLYPYTMYFLNNSVEKLPLSV
jgi:hypothetical protein